MIKCFEFDKLPEEVTENIKTEQYYTKASLKLYVGMDFGDKVGELKVGPSYVIAEVPDDYTGGDDIHHLLEKVQRSEHTPTHHLFLLRIQLMKRLENCLQMRSLENQS